MINTTPNLCLSGGTMLNSVCAGRLARESIYGKKGSFFIPTEPSDAGTPIGATLFLANMLEEKKRKKKYHHTPYECINNGKKYSNEEIVDALKDYKNKVEFEKLTYDEIIERVSDDLVADKVVAWFQGCGETGPRALGNRSLLAHPGKEENKDRINEIKGREKYRPICPSVLSECATEWFNMRKKDIRLCHFMSFVFDVKKEKGEIVPAICHVDGSARLQTVDREVGQKYYDLIKKFYEKTDIPMVVNTSFNFREPIVESPDDALKTFLKREGINVLVMENYYITRKVSDDK